ncbi:hypothetical protein M404DRAFT_44380, partial [Pisolithus tinctorius Marx 270]
IMRSPHHNTLPNFIGQYFPSCDDEDQQSFYYASMLMLLKPWRNLQIDLKDPSETWEEAFNAFCSTASPRDHCIISNIQYFHKCEAAAQCEGLKLTTMQVSKLRGLTSEELELNEDVSCPSSDKKFTEEGLAVLVTSQKPWWEELHTHLAVEVARAGGIFNSKWGACLTDLRIGTDDSTWRGMAPDIEKLLAWKQQMEQDVQRQNSVFSVTTVQDHSDDCNTASVTCNDGTGLAGVTYHDPEDSIAAEVSLPPIDLSMLKADQYRAYNIITRHLDRTLSGYDVPPLRMLILGEGGTGKSKVIQTIMEYFAHRGVVHILLKAASIVNGKTTHTIAMVSAGKDMTLSDESKAKLQQFWQHISYLIIDELSMLAKKFLAILLHNISTAKMSQLRRAIYMEFMMVVILKEQMHVTDPVWHDFLEHLRYG